MENKIEFEMNGEMKTTLIKDDVPFQELLQAIADGVAICYGEDNAFHPELVDFAIEYEALKTLTDLEIGEDAASAYRYIRAIDGVASVDADFIADGIRASVEYRNSLAVASVQSAAMFALLERIDGVASSFDTMLQSGTKLLNLMMKDVEKNSDLDLNGLVKMLTQEAMPEKMAAAVLDYQAAKQQLEENPGQKKRAVKRAVKK